MDASFPEVLRKDKSYQSLSRECESFQLQQKDVYPAIHYYEFIPVDL